MKEISLYLADDHKILRDGLRYIIGTIPHYKIVGESGDGKKAFDEIERLKPNLAILDISMPSMTGVEITRQLKKYYPEIGIIILSKHDNEEYVYQLLKYGINGYVLKDNAGEDLLKAIEEVLNGNVYLSPQITGRIIANLQKPDRSLKVSDLELSEVKQPLSTREKEILKLLAEGKSNFTIASLLRITDKTVKTHRLNIMKKLNIHNTAELVIYAVKSGLVEI